MDTGIIVPEGYPHAGEQLEEIISPDLVQKRVCEIGQEISVKYKGKVPIIIGVLNGAFLFMADLVRNLSIQFEVDFIKIDSYGDNTVSSGTVRLLKDISADITGRDVIVVEDIVDKKDRIVWVPGMAHAELQEQPIEQKIKVIEWVQA